MIDDDSDEIAFMVGDAVLLLEMKGGRLTDGIFFLLCIVRANFVVGRFLEGDASLNLSLVFQWLSLQRKWLFNCRKVDRISLDDRVR